MNERRDSQIFTRIKSPRASAYLAVSLACGLFFFHFSCRENPDPIWAEEEIKWDSFSDERIVNAIYKAEGGAKAQFAYGIRSIPYKTELEARQICFNSVRNGRRRWLTAGKPYDLIVYIGLRYCPPKAHPLNSNWVRNVKFFLLK